MAAATTYETAFILGAKYTGGPAFKRFDRDIKVIDRDLARLEKQTAKVPKNIAKVTTAANGAAKGMKAFFGGFVGGFAALGAAAIGAKVAQTFKDIATSAWDAALGVVRAKETSEALLKSYGMTSTKAHRLEEEFYNVAKASEASGHDAELMLDVMSRLKIIMTAADVKKGIDMWEDMVTVMSDASGPTEESAKAAAQAYVQAVKYNRGPLLKKLGYSKIEIANMQKLSEVERRALINERMRQRFAGATAQWRATDSGKLAVGMRDIENVMEDLGESAVANRGRIGELLSKIAAKTGEIARTELGPWFGRKIQEALEYFDEHLPDIIEYLERFVKQAQIIGGLGTSTGQALDAINTAFGNLGETLGRAVWGDENYEKMQRFWKSMTVESNQKQIDALYEYLKKGLEDSLTDSQRQWNAFATWWKTNIADKIEAWFKGLFKNASPEAEKNAEEAWDRWYGEQAGPSGGYVPPEPRGGSMGQFYSETSAPMGPIQNQAIANERARAVAQLREPGTRNLAAAAIAAEKADPAGRADVMESLVNRFVSLERAGQSPSMRKLLTGGFYGPVNRGQIKLSDKALADYDAALAAVAAGRNAIGGRTDQGMPREVRPGGRRIVRGEAYGWHRGTRYERETEAAKAGMRGMTSSLNQRTGIPTMSNNVNAPATVNINGVDAGNVPALASSVRSALRSRDREVLEMLRSARDYENHNAYT
jgi:hypothetical protein